MYHASGQEFPFLQLFFIPSNSNHQMEVQTKKTMKTINPDIPDIDNKRLWTIVG